MPVYVYDHDNYAGSGGRGYIDVPLGTSNLVPNSTNKNEGMEDKISSILISPEGGFEFCGYKNKNLEGEKWCYKNSVAKLESSPKDSISSYTNKMICDHSNHVWAKECNHDADTSKAINRCQENATCWVTRRTGCNANNIDLNIDTTCKNWCTTFPNACETSIDNYCKKLNIDTVNTDTLCSSGKTGYIKTKCSESGNFGNNLCKKDCVNNVDNCKAAAESYCTSKFWTDECKTYCNKNPNNCKTASQNYCDRNFDDSCKAFCKDNINICKSAIKKYCSGNRIKTDSFCKEVLVKNEMMGQHDQEIDRHCNAEGRQINLKNTDTLENPICACYDKEFNKAKYGIMKDGLNKTLLINKPECFLGECFNSTKSYKKSGSKCEPIVICTMELGDVNISSSKNITIAQNCGNNTTAPGTGVVSPGTGVVSPGTVNDITSSKVVDCQMEEWSKCSTKCNEGTRTRKKILGPLNGGKACGPEKEVCKILCPTLIEQVQNKYFNFNELDQNNQFLFIAILAIIIIFILF